jgi:hypothetical protein
VSSSWTVSLQLINLSCDPSANNSLKRNACMHATHVSTQPMLHRNEAIHLRNSVCILSHAMFLAKQPFDPVFALAQLEVRTSIIAAICKNINCIHSAIKYDDLNLLIRCQGGGGVAFIISTVKFGLKSGPPDRPKAVPKSV